MGFSFWHLLIITVIVLLLFGPNRLPNLGKSLGEAIRGFKKGLNEDEIDVTGASRREQLHGQKQEQEPVQPQTQTETKKDKV